jgi:hypothetical protein
MKDVLAKYLLQSSTLNEEYTRMKSQFLKNIGSTDMITKAVVSFSHCCGAIRKLQNLNSHLIFVDWSL